MRILNLPGVFEIHYFQQSAALKKDGTLWTWGLKWGMPDNEVVGENKIRFLNGSPNPVRRNTNVAAIEDGGQTIVKQDGTVWKYGDIDWRQIMAGPSVLSRAKIAYPEKEYQYAELGTSPLVHGRTAVLIYRPREARSI